MKTINYAMPQGIPGNNIEEFIQNYDDHLTDECKAEIKFNAKDAKTLDQYISKKGLGIKGSKSTQLLGTDRYFTTKSTGEVEFTPLILAKTNLKYNSKKIYISADLKNLLESLKPQFKDLLYRAIFMSSKVGTGKIYDKTTQRDPFIKELSAGKFKLTSEKKIVELRPQIFCHTEEHISGDARLIGWEQDDGYYFTEFGLHKHIAFNILKVISCLVEGEKIAAVEQQYNGGDLEKSIQSRLDKIGITSKELEIFKQAKQETYNGKNLEDLEKNVKALEDFKSKLENKEKTSWADRFSKPKYQDRTAYTNDIKNKSKDFCKQVKLKSQEKNICMI